MLGDENDELAEPRRPFWQKAALPASGLVALAAGGLLLANLLRHSGPSPRPHHELHIMNVKLPPPPPPPPPKTPPPPTKMQQAKQAPSRVPHPAPAKAPPKAPSPPAAASTSIQGNGPGALANGNGGGGDCIGEGCGSGDGSGGDAGEYYKRLVDGAVQQALERDDRLRYAHFSGTIALILDRNGRALRVNIPNFDGDAEQKAAIVRDLQQIAVGENLPADMSNNGAPWVVRISAHARG